jgi:hypothetical protein
MVVLAAVWAGFVAASTAMYGKGDNVGERLINAYRKLLLRIPFLWLADLLLVVACGLMVYQLLAFRQIEFYSEEEAVLILNDNPGDLQELGILKGKTAQKFRLGLGKRHLVFLDPTTKDPRYSTVVSIQPIWKTWEIDRIAAPKLAKGTYGKTKP